RDNGGRVAVVAATLIAYSLGASASAPVREIELGIVATRDPYRRAARLPRVALPGFRTPLAGRRNRERLPGRLASAGVQRLDEAADAKLSAGDANHDLPLRDQGRQGHVVALLVVLDLLVPDHLARFRVEGHDVGVERGQVDLVLIEAHPAVRGVQLKQIVGQLALVP